MRYFKILLPIALMACTLLPAYAESKSELEDIVLKSAGLKPGDEGWLKARYAACKLKYDFDVDIFQNCYENGKVQDTYALMKIILEGRPELAIMDRRCMKYSPLWPEVMDCVQEVLDELNNKQ